jgi:hypothetical protein
VNAYEAACAYMLLCDIIRVEQQAGLVPAEALRREAQRVRSQLERAVDGWPSERAHR